MRIISEDLFGGACEYCHIPHKAKGDQLWTVSPRGPEGGWGSRPIAKLCYTCHDNTGGGFNANDVTATAYSDFSHGFVITEIPPQPDGMPPDLSWMAGKEIGLLDCTTCHDPHSNTPPFIGEGDIDRLCKKCHGRENPGVVGKENVFGEEETAYSLHPTEVEYEDLSGNGVTNLHAFPQRLEEPAESGNWRLGAHRVGWEQGAGPVGCQTCHPVHGGWNYFQDILPGPPAKSLLALENTGGNSAMFCQLCHQGGDPEELVGTDSDHPINSNDGDPATLYPPGWPAGEAGEVTCSSCHDAHGGKPATNLLRKGGNEAEGWCFSCHSLVSLMPPYHHSSRENDDPVIFESALTCGDCHGRGPGWSAHNGFEGFKVEVLPNSSSFCEACHLPEHPGELTAQVYSALTGYPIDFSTAAFPASHGRQGGRDSHLLNDYDDDSVANCEPRTSVWTESGGLSKYGQEGEIVCESCHGILRNAGLLLGTDDAHLLAGGWKSNLLLAPYEDNDPGLGVEQPDFFPGPTLSALCRGCHYSVREGNEPTFVHNPPAHTVVDYLYPPGLTPYGRETLEIITAPFESTSDLCPEVSSADQMTPPSGIGSPFVPGAFSYPAEHVMDCDSCHRPHGGDTDSADDGVHRILEYTEPGRHGTAPCLECHDTDTQCGFEGAGTP